MFSLQPRDELVFGTPNHPQDHKEDQITEDLTMDQGFKPNNFINFSSGNSNLSGMAEQREREREGKYEGNIRRVLHRDIERKRRKEMSNLHLTLRSIIPLQHLKGKRAVCDQMQEAVSYIKQMKNNIQELRIRKEKLEKSSQVVTSSSGRDEELRNRVTLNPVPHGMEILIFCSIKPVCFGLSTVLQELMESELDVVSCISTKTTEGFLHKIQIEAVDATSINALELQDKLNNSINNLG